MHLSRLTVVMESDVADPCAENRDVRHIAPRGCPMQTPARLDRIVMAYRAQRNSYATETPATDANEMRRDASKVLKFQCRDWLASRLHRDVFGIKPNKK